MKIHGKDSISVTITTESLCLSLGKILRAKKFLPTDSGHYDTSVFSLIELTYIVIAHACKLCW